ncbi:MAG: ribosomal RNA small subunit methyltransferase A [Anaerolineae bacterium]|nr:ribosomal RNA small subunit methyltransferase A [Anaerolineae bacterium]
MNPKHLMDSFQLQPKKSLGQNFLHDPNALDKIVHTADLASAAHVLEIGAGTGALTIRLAQADVQVTAIEIDERLIPILQQQIQDFPNVKLIHGNILDLPMHDLVGDEPYSVVANLPYYITSAILRHVLEAENKPQRLVLTIQQEVAERIIARPGDLSLLAVSVQFYGKPSIVSRLNPAAFWPRPDVDSAVVKIEVYPAPIVEVPSEAIFFRVVRAGFSQKRKQLKNSLGAGLEISHPEAAAIIAMASIDPTRRAETLALEEWAAIARVVAEKGV